MRRDSIFYALFQQWPGLLFELLDEKPVNAEGYRFDSVAVKEPKFEIDGVFLPPESESSGVVYFCEVQFQRDEQLYERLFGELFLYFYRNRDRFEDWQAVVIYPDRATEQGNLHPYRALLNSDQVHRVYLRELGEVQGLSLGVALMALTTIEEGRTPEVARSLLARSEREVSGSGRQAIIEMLTTILVYRFANLTRREAEAMLGITLQETRFYQEAKEDGLIEGRLAGERAFALRQLNHRFGTLPESIVAKINTLSIETLESSLAEALLDFQSVADLEAWLNNLPE